MGLFYILCLILDATTHLGNGPPWLRFCETEEGELHFRGQDKTSMPFYKPFTLSLIYRYKWNFSPFIAYCGIRYGERKIRPTNLKHKNGSWAIKADRGKQLLLVGCVRETSRFMWASRLRACAWSLTCALMLKVTGYAPVLPIICS